MTAILNIPLEATLDSVKHILARRSERQVVLNLPNDWNGLDNLARMRLLQRQAQFQGVEVALITHHEPTRRAAKAAGIPVFLGAQEADKPWRMRPLQPLVDPKSLQRTLPDSPPWHHREIVQRRSQPTLHRTRLGHIRKQMRLRQGTPFWVRMAGYSAAAALLAALLLFFVFRVLPAATIILVPGRAPIAVTVPLTASPFIERADPEMGQIPARLVEVTLEERGAIPTTGFQQKPKDKALGEVVFVNLGNTAVQIPVGTVVATSSGTPVRFRTTAPAALEGGVGVRVNVPIEAVEPGVEGNVRANTINTVDGALRFRARVSNPNGTFGGGSQLVPVVTQEDQNALLAQLQERIDAKAADALAQEVGENEWLVPDSVQTFVTAQVFDQFKDDEATELTLTLRALAQGTALEEKAANEAMLAALESAVPPDARLVADTIRFERAPGAATLGSESVFTMTADADYIIPIDPAEIRQAVAGLRPAAAAEELQSRWSLSLPPAIYQDPGWMPALPRFSSRIQVRVEYGGALDEP